MIHKNFGIKQYYDVRFLEYVGSNKNYSLALGIMRVFLFEQARIKPANLMLQNRNICVINR